MKKHKLSILGFGLMLLIASCKKNDVQHENTPVNPTVATASAAQATSATDWKQAGTWTPTKHEKFTTYNSTIQDSSITSAVTSSGLVLAFAKNGTGVNALPYQEKGTSDSYWYYQVSQGAITFSCDAYSSAESLNSTTFKYYVLTAQQLKDLEAKGHSKLELMTLTYEKAAALLAK
jgi:hypothetical protein